MAGSLISLLFAATLYFYLAFILRRVKSSSAAESGRLNLQRDRLQNELQELNAANRIQARQLEDIVKLYDIIKAICSSLNEDEVFNSFRGLLDRHITFKDCRFIKEEAELLRFKDYAVFPIGSGNRSIGYLLVSGLNQEDQEKFEILRQQFLLGIKRANLYQKVAELAVTDSLTGVFSRRYLMQRFDEEIERSKQFKLKFAVLMIDIDHFKYYNDQYGHLVGDAILKEAARLIKESIRQVDILARYGGEEFTVILTEIDRDRAMLAAERILQSIRNKEIGVYDEKVNIAVSIGLAVFPEDAGEPVSLIERSDQALYAAKHAGRNRVCAYE